MALPLFSRLAEVAGLPETAESVVFAIIYLKNIDEPRDTQQVVDLAWQPVEDQTPPGVGGGGVTGYEFTNAGTVEVSDCAKVEDDLSLAAVEEPRHLGVKEPAPLADNDTAVEFKNDNFAVEPLVNYQWRHGEVHRSRSYR